MTVIQMHLRSVCSVSGTVLDARDAVITSQVLSWRSTDTGAREIDIGVRLPHPLSMQPFNDPGRKVLSLPFQRERTDTPEIKHLLTCEVSA